MAMLRAALYCRLSKDDMLQGDSESIKTQKAMLTQYTKEHGFLVVRIYVDDGYSGLNFDCPSFNRMLDDIEVGKIDVVITKDLSRLGRDHLKVGHFTEIYFPMKNVRYIAVNDGVDTANKNNDIAALKNVMNEFYSRDNSRKIRSSICARAKAGLYRSSFNPIGYRKSPDNHNKLIVDEETAWIVKRIFELANAGMGAHKIATVFRKEQVPCPLWWLHNRGEKDYSKRFENPENKYEWSHTVICNIISNPLYLGHCVMCKTKSIFKVNASKKVPKEDWITVENTHEPLVTQEVFDGANEKILSRRRDTTDNFVSPFAGLVKCGTCGKALGLRYWTGKRHMPEVPDAMSEKTLIGKILSLERLDRKLADLTVKCVHVFKDGSLQIEWNFSGLFDSMFPQDLLEVLPRTETVMLNRTWIYCCTVDGWDELERMRQELFAYAESRQWLVVGDSFDNSKPCLEANGFRQMRDAAKQGRVDNVLVYTLDGLSKRSKNYARFQRQIEKRHVLMYDRNGNLLIGA